jgi:hypothetical protein
MISAVFSNQRGGELVEHLALAGDAVGQHHVEDGDAVSGDDKQVVSQGVGIPHLAADEDRQGEVGRDQGRRICTHRHLSSTSFHSNKSVLTSQAKPDTLNPEERT